MSYNPTYFGGAACGQPPSQYGPNYGQGPYNGQYSTSPQNGSYSAQYPVAAATPYAQTSGPLQRCYQSSNYLAAGPTHDNRTSFDSASPIMYSSGPPGGDSGFVQSRAPSKRPSVPAPDTHDNGCRCVIM